MLSLCKKLIIKQAVRLDICLKRNIFKNMGAFTHSIKFIDYLRYSNHQAERCTNSESVIQGLIIY